MYPFAPTCSQRSRGSIYTRNRKGERESPWIWPLSTGIASVWLWPHLTLVVAPVYRSLITSTASLGKPIS